MSSIRRSTPPRVRTWDFPCAGVALLWLCLVAKGQSPGTTRYEGKCSDAACHGDFLKRESVHAPVENGQCESCHEVENAVTHKFKLARSGAALCTECHDEETFQGKVVHAPVANGQCDACHDPHGGKAKGLLKAANLSELCLECHDETLKDLSFVHGPAAVGQCASCHDAHVSKHPKLVRAEQPALCFECHDDMKERIEGSKHVHEAVKGDCVACHKPHGAGNKMLLSSVAPALCADCHEDIIDTAKGAAHPHSPVTADGGCTTCHDAHASKNGKLVAGENTRTACLSCHNKEIKVGDRTIRDMAALLKDAPDHHGPIRDGDCVACHAAHGGAVHALLGHAYPQRFYSSFSEDAYKLCFECHEVEAFDSAETDDATAFRNGKQNLHHVHVNKSSKGRSCRACHDPHASRLPHHIVERSSFGSWTIPINFQATANGGTCQPGCHRAYGYDRETPVVNLPPRESPAEP